MNQDISLTNRSGTLGLVTTALRRHSDMLDYFFLICILCSYVLLLPEAPHGDGVRWAQSLESHHLDVNPNYLLLEPIALSLYLVWEGAGLPPDGTQFQKYLDVGLATLSLFLLNLCLKTLAVPTTFRRLCIVFMAFSYNFFYLATSDHIKLVTAPFLMLTTLFLVKYFYSYKTKVLLAAGLSMGLSLCTLINALPWFGLLLLVLLLVSSGPLTQRIRVCLIFGLSATVTALMFLGTAYAVIAPGKPFLTWLTSYGANATSKEVGFGGLNWLTIGRALSAVIKNFPFTSDIGPVVKAAIFGSSPPPISKAVMFFNVLTFLGIAWILLRVWYAQISSWPHLVKAERNIVLAMASAVSGYFLFGLIWNTSEEEFWFQITAPVVILIAIFWQHRGHNRVDAATIVLAMCLVVTNTVVTFALPRHAYPYTRYVQELSFALGPQDLLIHDGSEPIQGLVYGMKLKESPHAINLSTAFDKHNYDIQKTFEFIKADIQLTRKRGGRVYIFDIFALQSTSHPWSLFRERFGISKQEVISFFESQGTYRQLQVAGQPAWLMEELHIH